MEAAGGDGKPDERPDTRVAATAAPPRAVRTARNHAIFAAVFLVLSGAATLGGVHLEACAQSDGRAVSCFVVVAAGAVAVTVLSLGGAIAYVWAGHLLLDGRAGAYWTLVSLAIFSAPTAWVVAKLLRDIGVMDTMTGGGTLLLVVLANFVFAGVQGVVVLLTLALPTCRAYVFGRSGPIAAKVLA